MTIPEKIRLALTYKHMSESELARRLGTTPSALNQRMKTGKFTSEEIERIAAILEAEFSFSFRFPDGTVI